MQDSEFVNRVCVSKKITVKTFEAKHKEFRDYKDLVKELNHKDYEDYRKNFFAWLGKSLEKNRVVRRGKQNSKIIKSSKYDKYRKESQAS